MPTPQQIQAAIQAGKGQTQLGQAFEADPGLLERMISTRPGASRQFTEQTGVVTPYATGRIQDIYQNTLLRGADQPGQEFYEQQYAGGTPLSDIQAAISASPEAQGLTRTGILGAGQEYEAALGRAGEGLEQFTETLSPWAQTGQSAYELQAALSGAMGPEAQAQAFAQYQESPEQDWLKEQSRREVENYAAATGQTLGGNVLAELQRRAIGQARQGYGDYYSRISDVAGTGGQAASQLASGQFGAGQFEAGLGARMGDIRYGAGRDLSTNIGQTISDLAGLQTKQGLTDADIYGGGVANVGNMINSIAQQMGKTPMDVAVMLANMATQQGTQQAPYAAGEGLIEAGGVSGEYEAYGQAGTGMLEAIEGWINENQ